MSWDTDGRTFECASLKPWRAALTFAFLVFVPFSGQGQPDKPLEMWMDAAVYMDFRELVAIGREVGVQVDEEVLAVSQSSSPRTDTPTRGDKGE